MKKLKYFAGGQRHASQDEAFIESLNPKKWTTGDSKTWDACWYTGMPNTGYFKNLNHRQNINHIPGNNSLTIKSFLHETLSSARNRQLDETRKNRYGFFPGIYDMPGDYHKYQDFVASNTDAKWILKPKNSSRGRGIEVVTNPLSVPSDSNFMVQQYLSNPDLILNRKYVLRLYVLITSIAPLQVYLYKEGLVKLASEAYSLDNLDNPFAHLTNPDINATNEKVDAPVVFYSLEHYHKLLEKRGQDPDKLFHQIQDLVTLTVIAAREQFRSRIERENVNQHACYELLGLDCMVDENLKPWILECNLSPSLETCTTKGEEADIEAVIKNSMVKDMVGLRGLNDVDNRPSPSDFETSAGFIKANLDYESTHCGEFERVYPASATVQDYETFFMPLKSDLDAAKAVNPDFTPSEKYAHSMAPHLVTDKNMLAIYDAGQQEFTELTAHEGFIWVKLMTGDSLLQTQKDFLNSFTQDDASIDAKTLSDLEAFPWDCAARWAEKGYCKFHSTPEGDTVTVVDTGSKTSTHSPATHLSISFKGQFFQIECHDASLFGLIENAYASYQTQALDKDDCIKIGIVRGQGGFHLIEGGQISNRLIKSEAVEKLNERLLRAVLNEDYSVALNANVLNLSEPENIQIVMNSVSKDFQPHIRAAGLLINLKTQDILGLALPTLGTLENKSEILPETELSELKARLSFAEYKKKGDEITTITDPVKIMNWIANTAISKARNLTPNQINDLVEIIQ